jgi:hypothetical protein
MSLHDQAVAQHELYQCWQWLKTNNLPLEYNSKARCWESHVAFVLVLDKEISVSLQHELIRRHVTLFPNKTVIDAYFPRGTTRIQQNENSYILMLPDGWKIKEEEHGQHSNLVLMDGYPIDNLTRAITYIKQ